MTDQDRIVHVVFSAIDDMNETLPDDKKFSKALPTILFDPFGAIDSLALTMFIVSLEQKIEQEFNVPVSLAGEYSMTDAKSPFRSVQSLVNYIEPLVGNKIHG